MCSFLLGEIITRLDLWPVYRMHLHLQCNWNINLYGVVAIFPISFLIGTAFISSGKDLIEIIYYDAVFYQ